MTRQSLEKLKMPDHPGVYIFKDTKKRPLYIGRATSLRDRVRSYFNDDLIKSRGPRIVDMITKSKSVSWQTTDSVLEAILLESELIKKYQPRYNVDEKDDKSNRYVVITDEDWPRVFLERVRDFDELKKAGKLPYKAKKIFGPYNDSKLIVDALKILRRLFPFKDKKAHDPRHESFYREMGKSPKGSDDITRVKYLETIKNLIMFFTGRKKALRKSLEKRMNLLADEMKFEEAGEAKRLLYALDHINDIALIKANGADRRFGVSSNGKSDGSTSFRIEAYDIAHMSGTSVVGAMIAFAGGEAAKSEYRRFKISKEINNDLRNLAELIDRRLNHAEWPYPDLIVVDGGQTQLAIAENILKIRRVAIPVVAVVKDNRHKASKIIGDQTIINAHRKTIVAANAEAHRFVIAYHRKHRSIGY